MIAPIRTLALALATTATVACAPIEEAAETTDARESEQLAMLAERVLADDDAVQIDFDTDLGPRRLKLLRRDASTWMQVTDGEGDVLARAVHLPDEGLARVEVPGVLSSAGEDEVELDAETAAAMDPLSVMLLDADVIADLAAQNGIDDRAIDGFDFVRLPAAELTPEAREAIAETELSLSAPDCFTRCKPALAVCVTLCAPPAE